MTSNYLLNCTTAEKSFSCFYKFVEIAQFLSEEKRKMRKVGGRVDISNV